MKKIFIVLTLILSVSACSFNDKPYEKDYATPEQMNNWAGNASLRELCRGLSSWRNPDVKQRAITEFARRNISIQYCYRYDGFNISPW